MAKPKLSWQGIGISSNPFQREEAVSLHLQTYLKESADSAERHLIVIPDEMQIPNYQSLHSLNESEARKIALKKGKEKQRAIRRIVKVNGIRNVEVLRLKDVVGPEQRIILDAVNKLYNDDEEIRNAVLSCIPQRLLDRVKDPNQLAMYALNEIGHILSMPGVKFGHDKERPYDLVARRIFEKYGLGNSPSFMYSKTGLEFVADKNMYVEPYSNIQSQKRLLLTDSKDSMKAKLVGLPIKMARKVQDQINLAGMKDNESFQEFYERIVAPTKYALEAPQRLLRRLGISFATGLAALLIGISGNHIHKDALSIRQVEIEKIPGYAFSGDIESCYKALDSAFARANVKIQDKYFIPNYFNLQFKQNNS